MLTLLTIENTKEYWSFGLNGSALGKSWLPTHTLKTNTYTNCIWNTEMNSYQRYLMTYAQFVNQSPHDSVHNDLVAFLKAKFAMLCYEVFLPWKMLCHESFGWWALRKWHIAVYLLEEESFTIIMIFKHLENQQSHKFLLAWLIHWF